MSKQKSSFVFCLHNHIVQKGHTSPTLLTSCSSEHGSRPPSAPPPGMLGLPHFLPLTRLPSARASAMRVLLTTPNLACFPYFALDTTTCMSTGPACSAYPRRHPPPFLFLPLLFGSQPEAPTPESILGLALFHFTSQHSSGPVRVLSQVSLQNVLSLSPATTTLGKAPLLPCGCSQGASSRTHPGLGQPLLPGLPS